MFLAIAIVDERGHKELIVRTILGEHGECVFQVEVMLGCVLEEILQPAVSGYALHHRPVPLVRAVRKTNLKTQLLKGRANQVTCD